MSRTCTQQNLGTPEGIVGRDIEMRIAIDVAHRQNQVVRRGEAGLGNNRLLKDPA